MLKKIALSLLTLAVLPVVLAATPATPAKPTLDKETQDDIARHRAIAAAHTAAAQCLEAGKGDAVCEKALQEACKGLAYGKFCGMKHAH